MPKMATGANANARKRVLTMSILERDEVVSKLQAWQNQAMDSEGIWQWALQAVETRSTVDDVIKAVMEMLCALPQDLWIEEDAEVMIDALQNPMDQSDLSVNLMWNYTDMIDQNGRRQALVQDPFYGPYCGN